MTIGETMVAACLFLASISAEVWFCCALSRATSSVLTTLP